MSIRRISGVFVVSLAVGVCTSALMSAPGHQGQGAAQGAAAVQGRGRQGGGFIPAPARRAGEGLGPFNRLVIRNVMVIDGTGAPPAGPMNVIVSNNRITAIQARGHAGRAGAAGRRRRGAGGRGGGQAPTTRSTAPGCT